MLTSIVAPWYQYSPIIGNWPDKNSNQKSMGD